MQLPCTKKHILVYCTLQSFINDFPDFVDTITEEIHLKFVYTKISYSELAWIIRRFQKLNKLALEKIGHTFNDTLNLDLEKDDEGLQNSDLREL